MGAFVNLIKIKSFHQISIINQRRSRRLDGKYHFNFNNIFFHFGGLITLQFIYALRECIIFFNKPGDIELLINRREGI